MGHTYYGHTYYGHTYYGHAYYGHAYCPGADSDWLGNVSLMMRTHLNGIIGMHQLLSATGLTVEQASKY
jgi:hypothetical protein